MLRPVYTEPDKCRRCYKCIRECPVKAIQVDHDRISIMPERCIWCGRCTEVCPTGAKKLRDGLTRARMTVAKFPSTILALDPAYVSEFADIAPEALVAAIRKLGFGGVSETALGARLVTEQIQQFLNEARPDVYYSSACPVVVNYIRKYRTERLANLLPVASPMIAHAKLLKQLYGEDTRIVYAGPCIGAKYDADKHSDLIAVAITFQDLRAWFDRAGILPETITPTADDHFIPQAAESGSLYAAEGGLLAELGVLNGETGHMAFSGLDDVKTILADRRLQPDRPLLIELNACEGGCINGPGCSDRTSPAANRYTLFTRRPARRTATPAQMPDLATSFRADPQPEESFSEQRIRETLGSIGKHAPEDELDCGSCGYGTCRDFARALLEGRARNNMCIAFMRRMAHDKATVLLRTIPVGIVIINANLRIADMNRAFAAAIGGDTLAAYELFPGMEGVPLQDICSFESYFQTVLATGEELKERRIRENGRTWLLSIYNISPKKQVLGVLQNLHEPSVRKEWLIEKTREVLGNHMTTVQKIAGLLGENAAYTDATLRSIIEAYDRGVEEIPTKQHPVED